MRSWMYSPIVASLLGAASTGVLAEDDSEIQFSACPLIGAYYPPPTISKSSESFAKLTAAFKKEFDSLVENGGSEKYGDISANTTSFSVVLFGGPSVGGEDPTFFEYHYTSPEDQALTKSNLTSDTKFPLGDVTMVFTVYAWLVEMGEQWETPITSYLPELASTKGNSLSVPWEDVTIGALAGQMSGLSRSSDACVVGEPCDWHSFVKDFAEKPPLFLPDTTPVVSYAAFQLLTFAMQRSKGSPGLESSIIEPLNMTSSGLLGEDMSDVFANEDLDLSQVGEPGALSMVSSTTDLARAGHAMLSSTLLSPAVTRRWLHPNADTSNLRNGVGRPWETYRAGSSAISPVLDVLTKSGTIGQYASYFGLTSDFGSGFAILAHDSTVTDRKLDLNVYADVTSEAIGYLQEFAAQEMAMRYAGSYEDGGSTAGGSGAGGSSAAVLNITDNGVGLEVQELKINGKDIKAETAEKLGIETADLDFRLYPSNVRDESRHQYIAVFQDKSAPIDMGTPTCITWQEVGADTGSDFNFVFELNEEGAATGFEIPGAQKGLKRTE